MNGSAACPPADILIIEDNSADVELVRVAVEECGLAHRLHFVRDGAEALLFLRRHGPYAAAPAPRLMILDLNMPRLGGLEVLAALRGGGPNIPAVIFTSSGDETDRQRALDLGAAAYLTKPMKFAEFCQTFTRLLEEHLQPS
ncbi:response regulator [Deinococcus geothermalis]|uniref:Response regulator receiver protein n=1 Tax=Deinococcus geothermalis (strain DSM 11300 / CIP 105573 / AG-3a) TaxID=319795 RepID=Q1IWJ5_DEIGD|nr:response regulator [Deinococcus geothermalis]ABF46389.1 response regulator receiver protein [Deinococcus geothermalis DSM 11300]